jgi:hypothetical protein
VAKNDIRTIIGKCDVCKYYDVLLPTMNAASLCGSNNAVINRRAGFWDGGVPAEKKFDCL